MHHRIMVAQVGQPKGWPVSFGAGIPTPVWATTNQSVGTPVVAVKSPNGAAYVSVQICGYLPY
ncbi:ash family protein [Salmonella enterica subsp. enterica serovar Bonariensis]|nr:ash family protein [Salmonella enterica subsp. enterica serovar Bonariensis]